MGATAGDRRGGRGGRRGSGDWRRHGMPAGTATGAATTGAAAGAAGVEGSAGAEGAMGATAGGRRGGRRGSGDWLRHGKEGGGTEAGHTYGSATKGARLLLPMGGVPGPRAGSGSILASASYTAAFAAALAGIPSR